MYNASELLSSKNIFITSGNACSYSGHSNSQLRPLFCFCNYLLIVYVYSHDTRNVVVVLLIL